MSRGSDWLEAHKDYRGRGCLIWPFSCCSPGYGQFYAKGRHHTAHRAMCELAHGRPPKDYEAAHSCGNRRCVNPQHLSWTSRSHNQRNRPGTTRPHPGNRGRFTANQVRQIRLSDQPTPILAALFDCTESNIRHVQSGTTYQHIPTFEQTAGETK